MLFCYLWVIKKTKGNVWEPGNTRDRDLFCKIIQKAIHIANKTNCWACAHLPERAEQGISLANISWRNSWVGTNFYGWWWRRRGNLLIDRPAAFHCFALWFIPWLGVSELEKAIMNMSASVEVIENKTMGAIHALQKEISQAGAMALWSRMALDMLFAPGEGSCTVINTSWCCLYVDRSGNISTDLDEVWKQAKMLHKVQKSNNAWRFDNYSHGWLPRSLI